MSAEDARSELIKRAEQRGHGREAREHLAARADAPYVAQDGNYLLGWGRTDIVEGRVQTEVSADFATSNEPCPVCGLDDGRHDLAQHGNFTVL